MLPTAAVRDITSVLLRRFILRHGATQELLVDCGHVFLSEVVADILQESQVVHCMTKAYHSPTDGLTKCFNSTLGGMLSMYVASDHINWDAILPFVSCMYNTATQSTTGFSPYFPLYSWHPWHTIDTILPYWPNASEYAPVSDRVRHAKECHELARAFTSSDREPQKSTRGNTTRGHTHLPS